MRIFILIILFFLSTATAIGAFDSAEFAQNKELRILRVTPEGEEDVQAGRQIVIQFNRPVVPIGRMERDNSEIPVVIEPSLQCQWRWLNTSALSCNLDEKMLLGKLPAIKLPLTQVSKPKMGQLSQRLLPTNLQHNVLISCMLGLENGYPQAFPF